MSKRREIDITAGSSATVDAVYALLADGTTWPRWSPIESYELEAGAEPTPDGIGEIRIYRRGRITGRDQIVEQVPGCRFAYRSLSGLPVRDYLGQVDLEPSPTGSTIRWRASFLAKIPGTGALLERGIRRFLDDCVQGLAQYAATSEQTAA
ncbi:MAG TPA: SRPBCC family protein [Acidimicrobiia bacterium]|nr:SRPBCC family protein [Acidimicrobiia bacterium]